MDEFNPQENENQNQPEFSGDESSSVDSDYEELGVKNNEIVIDENDVIHDFNSVGSSTKDVVGVPKSDIVIKSKSEPETEQTLDVDSLDLDDIPMIEKVGFTPAVKIPIVAIPEVEVPTKAVSEETIKADVGVEPAVITKPIIDNSQKAIKKSPLEILIQDSKEDLDESKTVSASTPTPTSTSTSTSTSSSSTSSSTPTPASTPIPIIIPTPKLDVLDAFGVSVSKEDTQIKKDEVKKTEVGDGGLATRTKVEELKTGTITELRTTEAMPVKGGIFVSEVEKKALDEDKREKTTQEEAFLKEVAQIKAEKEKLGEEFAIPQKPVTMPEVVETVKEPKTIERIIPATASIPRAIRTYQSDVVDAMKGQQVSVSKMYLAEKEKREQLAGEPTEEKQEVGGKGKKIAGIIVAVFLVLFLGGFVGYYFLVVKTPTASTGAPATELKIPSYIFPNYQKEVVVSSLKRKNIVDALEFEKDNINIPLSSIIQVFLTKEDSDELFVVENTEGFKILVTSESFLNALEVKASSSFLRSLKSDFVFGFHSSLGNNPFLIFSVKDYDNAYAGMLAWEKTLINDMFPLFQRENPDINKESYIFSDVVVSNKDVRAVLNSKGEIEFAYSFPDRETLIIANNETTVQELFRRLTNARLERRD